MKKLLMLAAAAAAILPMTAQAAGNASGAVTYTTTVPNTCAIYKLEKGLGSGYTEPTYNVPAGSPTAAAATVTFNSNELVDENTAYAKYHQEQVNLGGFCNYKHKLRLDSKNGGLINTSTNEPATDNFSRRINYEAYISGWGPGAGKANLDTTGAALLTENTPSPTSGDLTIDVAATDAPNARLKISTFNDTSRRLLAGTYTDVLTIRLGATF